MKSVLADSPEDDLTILRKEDLITLALGVREAVLHLRTSFVSAARHYPHEGQDALVRLVALHLESLGHEVAVSAGPGLPPVLLAGRAVVDLRFRGDRAPLVEVTRFRARQGSWRPVLFGVADAEAFSKDLALIQAFLARPAPDLRVQPFLPVVDRWFGMDVLSCGHLVTPRSPVTRVHRNRRCRYCAPVQVTGTFRVVADADVLDWFAAMNDAERGAAIGRLRTGAGVKRAGKSK